MDLIAYRRHLTAQGYARMTISAKLGAVSAVAREAGVEPAGLLGEHVTAYLADRPGFAAWSRRKYLEHLSDWCEWAGLEDVTAGVRRPPSPRGVPRPIGEPELAALLAAATARQRSWLVLGAFAGLRSGESARLRGDDLRTHAGAAVLRIAGKGGHVDMVPAAWLVQREVNAWRALSGDGPLWPGCTAAAVQHSLRRLAASVGVECSSHQLRHRYGTQLYGASQDLLIVQRLMRHASPVTTAGYARVSDAVGAALVDRLPLPALPVDDAAA